MIHQTREQQRKGGGQIIRLACVAYKTHVARSQCLSTSHLNSANTQRAGQGYARQRPFLGGCSPFHRAEQAAPSNAQQGRAGHAGRPRAGGVKGQAPYALEPWHTTHHATVQFQEASKPVHHTHTYTRK